MRSKSKKEKPLIYEIISFIFGSMTFLGYIGIIYWILKRIIPKQNTSEPSNKKPNQNQINKNPPKPYYSPSRITSCTNSDEESDKEIKDNDNDVNRAHIQPSSSSSYYSNNNSGVNCGGYRNESCGSCGGYGGTYKTVYRSGGPVYGEQVWEQCYTCYGSGSIRTFYVQG